ncbi:hypothetical protein QYF61_006134, partial [Mycteria americana]
MDIEPLTTTLWMRPSNKFLIYRTVHPSNPYLSNLERRMLWGTVKGLTEVQRDDIHSSSLAEQPQLSQPVFIAEMFQPSDHFCGPPLDLLQQVHVFLVLLEAPELDAVLQCLRQILTEMNHLGWKRPLRSSSPTVNLALPSPPLYHVPKHLIQTAFKYLQEWGLNHFPGQPVPMLDNPFRDKIFPNTQPKPPLVQLEAISSRPISCHLGEETDPHLTTASFQVVVESNKVSPQPPLLQAKQPQFPQPLLRRLLLQTLHQLRCPPLHTLQPLSVSLVVGGPKLNTAFEVRPHQCRVQGHNHFPSPAGHTIPDTSQDAVGLLGHLSTLPAHIQMAANQYPQVLFHQAAFQPLFPKPVALHGVAVAQVQDLALGLVEPHTIGLGPSIQPVQVPLQSLPTLKQINIPTQLGVICKLTEGALDPLIQIIDKDIKQNWPQHRALGNTACDRLPTGFNSIHHNSLGLVIHPIFYPAKRTQTLTRLGCSERSAALSYIA